MARYVDGLLSVFGVGPAGPAPATQQRQSCSAGTAHVVRVVKGVKYWQEQGWVLSGYRLDGHYRTFRGSFRGWVELSDSGQHAYYIQNPPAQLAQHDHAPCFMYRGNNTYLVHFSKKPSNVDDGIQQIETVMREALERY